MSEQPADPVLVVGTVAYDTVKTPFDEADHALGGSATYFASAASLFTDVHVVSIVGGDFDLDELDYLRKRGTDLSGIQVEPDEETFHWSGEYDYDMNTRTTHATDLNVLTNFAPLVPINAETAPLCFLANIDPNLQLDVLDQLRNQRLVAADTMNFWIENTPQSLDEVLARVDTLIINDEEAREIGDTPDLIESMRRVQGLGPEIVVCKKGEHGALLANRSNWFAAPAFLHADLHDPTGAGDAFAGGFMGTLAAVDEITDTTLRRAVVYGTAAASIAIEDFGPRALAKATLDEVEDRARELAKFSRFPPIK